MNDEEKKYIPNEFEYFMDKVYVQNIQKLSIFLITCLGIAYIRNYSCCNSLYGLEEEKEKA